MTPLEQETYKDGFRVALLGVELAAGRGAWRYAWRLFDGGRLVDRGEQWVRRITSDTEGFAPLLNLVRRVIAPPHVLVGFGPAWRDLLREPLDAARVAELRILDLAAAARALLDTPDTARTLDTLMLGHGVGGAQAEDVLVDDRHEALLWSVIARAGATGLDWTGLLGMPNAAAKVSFEGYAFDETALARLPNRPGVYVMVDRAGQVLYVGKSGDLARRLGEYFRPAGALPEKIATIRQRIHRFTTEEAGSELEALLLEHRSIQTLAPELNIQRQVASGRGRYGTPAWPKLVIMPSSANVRRAPAPDPDAAPPPIRFVEAFFFGETPQSRALQVRVDLARPPLKTLAQICGKLNGHAPNLKLTRAVRDWSLSGNAICSRYFGAHAARLHWADVPPGPPDPAYLNALLAVMRRAAQTGFDPAEVRF
jgi:hypothetical protein